MMGCQEVRGKIHLYVDNELSSDDSVQVEAHLMDCERCRAEHDAIRSVVDTVRGASPLYEVPESAARRVELLVAACRRKRTRRRWLLAAGVGLLLATAAVVVLWRKNFSERYLFASFAAAAHLRYARGIMPLDISSSEPQKVSAWLQSRLPFHVVLPNHPAEPERGKRYALVGARLLQFGDGDLAYIAYAMSQRPISLLIASSDRFQPAGEQVYRSGRLTFHVTALEGLSVITWADRRVSYALVSDVKAKPAESCAVCHGSAVEREKLEDLAPVP